MSKKQVAHLSTTFLEGSETFVYAFMQNLERYDPFVITEKTKNLESFPLDKVYEMKKLNAVERAINRIGRDTIQRNPISEAKYSAFLKKENPALMHAHFGTVGAYAVPLKKKLGLPLVTSFYGFDLSLQTVVDVVGGTFGGERYWKKAYARLFREGDQFLTYYKKGKKILVSWGCPHDKIIVHPTGIDLDKFTYSPTELGSNVQMIMVNRYYGKKGIEFAIRAMALLKDKYPNLTLKILGDGLLFEDMKKLASELNVVDKVDMPGSVPHEVVAEELRKSHIFLSPSVIADNGDDEGGGNITVLESMAAGVPVIATIESGGEFIFHGKTGLICNEWDAEDLADKISYMMESPNVWPQMVRDARQLVEKEFNAPLQAKKLEDIYDDVLARHGSR